MRFAWPLAASIADQIHAPPLVADPAMAERHHERFMDAVAACDDAILAQEIGECLADGNISAVLSSIFGNSPYLSHCAVRDPAFTAALLRHGPDAGFAALLRDLRAEAAAHTDIAALMRGLRVAKRRAALLIGLADIAGLWPLERVTAALSTLADNALSAAAAHLLAAAHQAGEIILPHPDQPERDSGLVILGMGKLGGLELNYSSDIDIIVFYDPDALAYRGRKSLGEMFIRLARDLVRIMEERTGDGYVFRTDLRLRPDPGSTPAAISLQAAELYYEGMGQNWERAAMIKARPVAGDLAAGAAFLKTLRPFIWRKHLDFAAIQDIHSIKRQINAHKGGSRIAVAGHNIKLGRGGIREIEFFAQTQQLIWGGREMDLRLSGTCGALTALAAAGHVADTTAAELTEAYHFLRGLEHRLQMTDDKQTQTLPADAAALRALALFCGFEGTDGFAQALTRRLKTVESHYAALFEDAPPLDTAGGNLVFTGGENDPDTLKTLAGMGFTNPESVASALRGWHHGRMRATRSTRARELLTELTPRLLAALAATAEPDAAFMRFDAFLASLPAGIALFSLFQANPGLLDLVAELMGDAPRLAETLARAPTLLDGVLSAAFFDPPPAAAALAADLGRHLERAGDDYQDMLDLARRWTNEQKFRIGVQCLRGLLSPGQAARHFSDLAEAVLATVQPWVEAEFSRAHGRFGQAGAALIAMGKMGSREMTAASDLDLILVYDVPDGAEQSDGPRPLSPGTYFARLTQRLINALTAKTAEGALYEVDMRLRPSGSSGPIATSLAAFRQYHEKDAWTWEHMALTRARVITGPPGLAARIETVIRETLTRRRDPEILLADVADMRRRMAREHGTDNPWEVKQRRGGMVDIDFIAQYLQLRWAADHPGLLQTGTQAVLERAQALGLLAGDDAETLIAALDIWVAVQQILRQTIAGQFTEEKAPGRLKEVLARAAHQPHFNQLKAVMAERAAQVSALYQRLIDTPASPILAARKDVSS